MNASKRTLRALAALVWYTGGILLLVKGTGYILQAASARPDSALPWIGAGLGALVGGIRGRRAFARGCRKNLARIDALAAPRIWEFFRPGFFLALGAMIGAGVGLRMIADAGGFWSAVVVGSLELVIAVALLASSLEFWRRGAGSAGVASAGEPAARDVA